MEVDGADNASPIVRTKPYTLINQKVDLDIGFDQRIKGSTQLTIFPEYTDLKAIVLNARQCRIRNITVNKLKPDNIVYADPCDTLNLHLDGSVNQHHIIEEKLRGSFQAPPDPELVIFLPSNLKIVENPEFVVQTATGVKSSKVTGNAQTEAEAAEGLEDAAVSKYTKLEVQFDFVTIHTRDALHFSVGPPGSGRWPHVYTRGGFLPGRASCLFPCIDSLYYRCTWEISITGPRTVGDALRQISGESAQDSTSKSEIEPFEAKEMVYVCPGEITDDVVSKSDPTKRTVSYSISRDVSAQHIGFAIGPFEEVDLATLREAKQIEMLGENAAPIMAYCLPGKKAEVEYTCLPTTDALDHYASQYAPYPYQSFSYCFVEDHPDRPASFAGLVVCSSRMLYPESIIDPQQEVTRLLIQTITTQWLGIQIVPKQPEDTWVVVGSALFLAELFMKELCGNNEHRWRMKTVADQVCELDHERPSIWDMGRILHVDPAEYDFLALKAPLVLFILDNRIKKEHGSHKMGANIGKFMSRARMEDLKDNLLPTQEFCKMTEKVLHAPIDDFVNQWVKGAGTPTFTIAQKFNKKRLVVEMTIRQGLAENALAKELEADNFMRDVREEFNGVWANEPQNLFTGPMTIRIHEADGTPYEHIVQIKEANQKIEVPYNTKYKRLKRSKKQRAKNAPRVEGDEEQEPLLYCLGDVLQEDDEMADWQISEWSAEDEARMNTESYEWIRVDADFEWIAKVSPFLPGPMFVSQLQQDKDVDAQLFSLQSIGMYSASRLISSILVRTMMDNRYFHGIRRTAAELMVKHASSEKDIGMIGLFHLKKAYETLYCVKEGDAIMARPNDFSDQLSYRVQCAILEAISRVRDERGHAPDEVRKFLFDKLKFNDNSQNDYSDAYFVLSLLKGFTSVIIAKPEPPAEDDLRMMTLAEQIVWGNKQQEERQALDEIDRYRRMDEWTSSYQNLYSRTALECQARLSRAGIRHFTPMHFLQYARPGNYDMLRCTAYEMLAAEAFQMDRLLHNFVHGMTTVGSPYIRQRMRQAFGKALARKALGLGSRKPIVAAAPEVLNDLTVDAAPVAAPIADAERRTSIDGALKALKVELADNLVLKKALWQSLCHPDAGYEDVRATLEFCQMLYEKHEEARFAIALPHYWRCEYIGNGKLTFRRSDSVRTKAREVWQPQKATDAATLPRPATSGPKQAVKSSGLTLKLTNKKVSVSHARTPPVSATPTPPPSQRPSQSGSLKKCLRSSARFSSEQFPNTNATSMAKGTKLPKTEELSKSATPDWDVQPVEEVERSRFGRRLKKKRWADESPKP
ncbi:Transcription initiation factor TFIID subunit 2 [Lithohypha guttulata]|nr:Transcription initiation factor TFIID subunit 2 [Lithohypha guttulata]